MGTNEQEPISVRANNPINLSADGPAWDGIMGKIAGDPSINRPDILSFRTMQLGMRAALKNNVNAARNRPNSTVAQQVARHANTSDPKEIQGFIQFLAQHGIDGTVKLKDADPFRLTAFQGVFESGRALAFNDPRWEEAALLLEQEGFVKFNLPRIQVEEGPRR